MRLAHLGHAELWVSDLEASRSFFSEVMGLTVTDEDENCVYLRAWQDWEHHTLLLRRAERSQLHHIAFRVQDPKSLRAFASRFEETNVPHEWVPAGVERGQGEALRFTSPGGIPLELYWDMEKVRFQDAERGSILPSFPQKYPTKGIAPRRVDHANVLVDDAAGEQRWFTEVLGMPLRYYAESADGRRLGSWLSVTNLSHDIAIMRNRTSSGGRLHHLGYFVDTTDELLRAATILVEHGGRIEWGPGKHATSGATFLYFFEPSGHRIEIWTGGMLIFAPDWEPIRWDSSVEAHAFDMWGTKALETYFTHGSEPAQSIVGCVRDMLTASVTAYDGGAPGY